MYQQITLIGHLGNDPEMRYTPNGVAVASFRMATSRTWSNANGERQEKTTWFRISVWGKQAETVSQYLHKGSKVLVTGEVEDPNVYTDKAGEARAGLEIKAQNVRFLSGRNDATDNVSVETSAEVPF